MYYYFFSFLLSVFSFRRYRLPHMWRIIRWRIIAWASNSFVVLFYFFSRAVGVFRVIVIKLWCFGCCHLVVVCAIGIPFTLSRCLHLYCLYSIRIISRINIDVFMIGFRWCRECQQTEVIVIVGFNCHRCNRSIHFIWDGAKCIYAVPNWRKSLTVHQI